MQVSNFLEEGETLGSIVSMGDTATPNYFLWPVAKEGRKPNDRVMIDVLKHTDPIVIIGGNVLHLETLHGMGQLMLVNLSNGQKEVTDLREGGNDIDVPIGTVHWYENLSQPSRLLIRDTSLDFELENEVKLASFVQAIINSSITAAK